MRKATSMKHNPYNASISITNPQGFLSIFVPSMSSAAVKLNCHNSLIRDHGYSSCGNYLVTAASDSSIKIWDLRKTYHNVAEYFSQYQPSCIDVSQKDILGIAAKSTVVYFKDWMKKDQNSAYLKHQDIRRRVINDVKFVPYEDFMGIGLNKGFSSILVPGSCKVEFDTFTHNITNNKKQKRENAVHKLLEKLPMQTIVLNPYQIGRVDPTSREVLDKEIEDKKKEIRIQKIKDQKRRKRSKIKGHKFKELQRNQIIREQVKDDTFARKVLYQAEAEKEKDEVDLVEESGPKFIKMGKLLSNIEKDIFFNIPQYEFSLFEKYLHPFNLNKV